MAYPEKILQIYKHFLWIWFIIYHDEHYTKNSIFFLQMFWKDGLSKKLALEQDLSCNIRKDVISFSRKYDLIL